MNVNVIKTVTVRGRSEGLSAVKADLDGVTAAQDRVAKSGDAMARSTETTARRQLSAGRDFQRLMERNDRMIYLQTQLARETATVNRAFEQGAVDATRHAAAIELVESKYRGLVAAEERARAAAQGLVVANDNQAASLHRLAAANDNARGSTANVAAQFQDIGVTAAMGMSPIMIALQQGTQLSAVLSTMKNPVMGLATAFMSILNPVSLLTIGFVALAAAAIQWFMSAKSGAEGADSALQAHGDNLDRLLKGYDNIREAANLAAEAILKLPEGVVASDLAASLEAQEDALARIGAQAVDLRAKLAAVSAGLMAEDRFRTSNGGNAQYADEIAQIVALKNIALSAHSTKEELDAAAVAARNLYNTSQDPNIKDWANEFWQLAEQLRATQSIIGSTEVAMAQLNMTDLSGMESWSAITNDTRLGLSLVERAALAAAWAIANSGGAAEVAASQYGTATGAANAYANAMFRLGSLIPSVAAAQAQFGQLQQAEGDYTAAIRENQAMLENRSITMDQFAAQQAAATKRYQQAQDAVTGLTDAQAQLDQVERDAAIGGMAAQEAAAARITDKYAALEAQLTASGAGHQDFARLTAAMNAELGQSAASFAETAAAAGGAASALKTAEADFNSFIGTADKLAEALFPGEYARREAAELMALLDQYRDKLDSFQIAGVEREIANFNQAADMGLRRIEDTARDTADGITQTLGSVLSSLFDSPIKGADDFFNRVMSGLAQLGNQNLGKLFDSAGAANDNGASPIVGAFGKAVEKGVFGGLDDFFKSAGVKGGLGGAASAGLGGFGMGYQTQNPVMGALGGALQGFAAGGPVGAVIGGLAGIVGGIFGMNEALEKARKQLAQNRAAIEDFIAAGNGDEVAKYTKALRDYQAQAQQFIELANQAQDSDLVGKINAAAGAYRGTLADKFAEELGASINRLRGDDFINEVADAQKAYNQRMKDAVALGADGSAAFTELSLSLQQIVTDSDLTAEQMSRLVTLFPDLAALLQGAVTGLTVDAAQSAVDRAREDLRASYDAEASALRQVIDRNRAFIASLQEFKANLALDSSLSGLSPMDRFRTAEAQYRSVSAAARSGDEAAIGKLEDVSRAYLDAAKGYYASSEQYFAVFADVSSTLDQVIASAQGNLSSAERQLSAVEYQVRLLIDIDASVRSVADATNALTTALANLVAVQGGGYVPLPGFASGGSFAIGGNGGIDQNLLSINGRPSARVGRGEIVDIRPARPGSNDNGNGAMLAELRALREEVASLRGVTAAGAQAVVQATAGTTEAVQTGNRQASQAALRRS